MDDQAVIDARRQPPMLFEEYWCEASEILLVWIFVGFAEGLLRGLRDSLL
jgi:hypothetical protein